MVLTILVNSIHMTNNLLNHGRIPASVRRSVVRAWWSDLDDQLVLTWAELCVTTLADHWPGQCGIDGPWSREAVGSPGYWNQLQLSRYFQATCPQLSP